MKHSIYKYLALALTLFCSVGLSSALAQEVNLKQLVIADDLSPEERLAKKLEFTETALRRAAEKVEQMQTDLGALLFTPDSAEEAIRASLLTQTNDYITFYQAKLESLKTVTSIEGVDVLIDEVIAYREATYTPGAKNILEFILVFSYNPSVVQLAQTRLDNIRSDVERLEGLDLVSDGSLIGLIDTASTTLAEAIFLSGQARASLLEGYATPSEVIIEEVIEPTEPIATSTPAVEVTPAPVTARSLAEQSLGKVKLLYEQFLEIGGLVDRAIGIN